MIDVTLGGLIVFGILVAITLYGFMASNRASDRLHASTSAQNPVHGNRFPNRGTK